MPENQNASDRPIDALVARALKGAASPPEQAAVDEWRRASRANDVEYRELARIVHLAARVGELVEVPPRPTAAHVMRRAGASTPVIPLRRRLFQPRSAWIPAAAAAAAALLVVSLYETQPPPPSPAAFGIQQIATAEGETATLELLDGTVVRLGPSSRLRMVVQNGMREVALEGRSFFAVAEREDVPFVISTAAGEVTVLGTRIDVEARGRDLRLVVVEGLAALSSGGERAQVGAGEMGRIVNGEPTAVVRVPDVGAFVEWTGNFLAFQSTPLRDAARDIERVYGVRVTIPDEQLAQRVITAWFWDTTLAEVMDVVCLAVAARCTVDGNVVRILPEPATQEPPAGARAEG